MDGDASSMSGTGEYAKGFRILYQKTLPFPARRGLAGWSPQLDLIALVTTSENVLLYRMNGQRVWGIAHKLGTDVTVQGMQWRPDGKMIALGYSDGSTRIFDVNNGKTIHRIVSEDEHFGAVTCIGWVDNHSHTLTIHQIPEFKNTECTPQALFELDITSMLPRLSVLPSSSGPESTFTSKTTLDALINAVAKGGEGGHLDVLLIGEQGGKILLNVFDSFLVGTMDLSSISHQVKPGTRLLRHTASSNLSTHSLFMSEPGTDNLLYSTMDILFIHQFGQYLFQLASTSTRVQALLRYIRETVTSLETEFKTMNDFAQRFVSIIQEDAEKAGSEAGLELFEFLVTGIPSAALKEWLLDVLTERNQKRWEKTSTTGYETLRRLVHENLLPTCERLTVLFCRLRGLARWKESGSPLGLEPDDFTRCLDIVSGITLFAHDFLLSLNEELDLFTCFSTWIRHALDQLSTVATVEDKPVEDPQIDTLKVVDYVENYLKESSLGPYFARNVKPRLDEYTGESITELYSKTEKTPSIPGFMDLAQHLEDICKMVFSKPQRAMRQQLRIGKPVLVNEQPIETFDVRVLDVDKERSTVYLVLAGHEPLNSNLTLVRIRTRVDGGLSSVTQVDCARLSIPGDQRLVDVKFVDDSLLIAILSNPETSDSELVTFDYQVPEYDGGFHFSGGSQSICDYGSHLAPQQMTVISRRAFDATWVPVQVVVNGKEGRRVGCVIADDDMKYYVFDLDHEEVEEEEGEEEEEEGEEEGEEKGEEKEEGEGSEGTMEVDNAA